MPIYALGEHQPEIHPDAWVMPEAVLIGRVRVGAQVHGSQRRHRRARRVGGRLGALPPQRP